MLLNFLKHNPTKIIAVGLNYKDHAKEMNMPLPKTPLLFMKPPSSIISNKESIILPSQSKRVDYEAELAIIIGKECKGVSEQDALDYIEGYTCLNDVTARDLQKLDGQWTRAKSFDTFCPIGPTIAKDIYPNNVKIRCILNDKIVQESNTSNFIFKVDYLVSFISKIMALYPGDIITTGTPPGVGKLNHGDKVEVEIEGIGTLTNYVT